MARIPWCCAKCGRTRSSARSHWPGRPPTPDDNPTERLRVALRTLHIKAGLPAPEVLAEATRHPSRTEDIDAALAGNAPHWPQLVDLVQVLGGDPAYFQRLWEASSCRGPAGNPWPGSTTAVTPRSTTLGPPPLRPRRPGPRRRSPIRRAEHLVHMFQMFGPVLAASPRTR
ncbi:hypothetical protein [Actinacidiphila soli]|uniref:hypothetical protein n=1 Tax=Actinacidiphila soli TaxID=2487275 RepID=UPI001F0CA9EE|nr:hypothetical protein [Actinacidiphila soli]